MTGREYLTKTHNTQQMIQQHFVQEIINFILFEITNTTASFPRVLFLYLFWNVTSRYYWNRFFNGKDILPITQKHESTNLTINLA